MTQIIGIVLVNEGSPEEPTKKALKKYAHEMFNDRRTHHGSLSWRVNAYAMASNYALRELKTYESIWTESGSPVVSVTKSLAAELERRLYDEKCQIFVDYAMVFGGHLVNNAFSRLRAKGCTKVLVLPLFPQRSLSLTAAVADRVAKAKTGLFWDVDTMLIDHYHDNAMYAQAMARSIEHAGYRSDRGDRLLMAFRSIPLEDIENDDDDYELQVGATSLLIAGELGLDRKLWTLAYFEDLYDKREHLGPYAREVASRWGKVGKGRMFVALPGYSTETAKTLDFARNKLRDYFKDSRLEAGCEFCTEDYTVVPCLGKTRAHVRVLLDILQPYVNELKGE